MHKEANRFIAIRDKNPQKHYYTLLNILMMQMRV